MDIFFVVTTTVVLAVGILFSLFLFYLVKVVRDLSEITARVKKEANEIADDVSEMREDIKEGYESAKEYTKVVAGASIVRGLSNLMQAFMEERANTSARKRTRKKS